MRSPNIAIFHPGLWSFGTCSGESVSFRTAAKSLAAKGTGMLVVIYWPRDAQITRFESIASHVAAISSYNIMGTPRARSNQERKLLQKKFDTNGQSPKCVPSLKTTIAE